MKGFFGYMVGLIFTLRCKFEVLDVSQGMSVGIITSFMYLSLKFLLCFGTLFAHLVYITYIGPAKCVTLMEKLISHLFFS